MHHVRIVLVNTSHPGNIGATARAMKTMGFTRLVLVNPKEFPHHEATARAAGADDLLQRAVIATSLAAAVADCQLVLGTSARSRHLPWPMLTPRECAAEVGARPHQEIALVFGNERVGLSNEELALCHYHVRIPTVDHYSSLNLAAAVQVLVYELSLVASDLCIAEASSNPMATVEEVEGLYNHFQRVLVALEFLDLQQPKFLMQRLRRLFNRSQLERDEVNLLRGILTAMDQHLSRNQLD